MKIRPKYGQKYVILVLFSTPPRPCSPTQRRTGPILRTHDGHPTPSTPDRGRPVSGAPCPRFEFFSLFLVRGGRVCIYRSSYKTAPAGGARRTFFSPKFQLKFKFLFVFLMFICFLILSSCARQSKLTAHSISSYPAGFLLFA